MGVSRLIPGFDRTEPQGRTSGWRDLQKQTHAAQFNELTKHTELSNHHPGEDQSKKPPKKGGQIKLSGSSGMLE